jgi:hypothetical protein
MIKGQVVPMEGQERDNACQELRVLQTISSEESIRKKGTGYDAYKKRNSYTRKIFTTPPPPISFRYLLT